MASAFSEMIKSVVRELDPRKELTPVDSLGSSANFQPYQLVLKRPSSRWFGQARYSHLNLHIMDILESCGPDSLMPPAPQQVSMFHFLDVVDGELQGSVELSPGGQGMLRAGASVSGSNSTSVHVAKLQVDPNVWTSLQQQTRLRKPEPKVLQQLRQHKADVYVVTEVLRTEKETEATLMRKREGSGQFTLPGALGLQGKGQGHMNRRKKITIPSGSVLAFHVALLVIDSNSCNWEVVLFPEKKQKTFKPAVLAIEGSKKFRALEAEAEGQTEGLCTLSRELCHQMLQGLHAVMQEEETLQALEDSLEQGMWSGYVEKQDGPVGSILECLVTSSRKLEDELMEHTFYLLGALNALTAAQRALLAQELKARTLLGPLSLVRSLLKQTAPWDQCREVTLHPGPPGNGLGPAWVLLEHCGLEVQADKSQVRWVPEALEPTHALYACLVLLAKLSEDL
ncbi:gasdermin-D [Suncus etruscus]|uniref:gasdermin-D n=1 Tax=Suncus etruscus TaxID=109475 RepID=UPI002110C9A7|nr:gasdermin-D [Suncus etruscus]